MSDYGYLEGIEYLNSDPPVAASVKAAHQAAFDI